MIARLKGRIEAMQDDTVILDVNGVGYLVACSARTLSRLPATGEAAALWIETVVREDAILLYGFLEASEKAWFKRLTTVQGVGTKVALAILSVAAPDALGRAIAAGDKAALTRANGVGPRLAQRILSELKDKTADLGGGAAAFAAAIGAAAKPAAEGDPLRGVADDAISALVNLGYGQSDAFAAVARVLGGLGADAATPSVETVIARALKDIAISSGLGGR